MLTAEMQTLITHHSAGMVASIRDDGTPAVSPKATFLVLSDSEIAYGDIRSPGTAKNIAARPNVEVCFIDVLTRQAVRVRGTAEKINKADADAAMTAAFEEKFGEYLPHMSGFVKIDITAAELILSPGYDVGYTEQQLKEANLARLNAL